MLYKMSLVLWIGLSFYRRIECKKYLAIIGSDLYIKFLYLIILFRNSSYCFVIFELTYNTSLFYIKEIFGETLCDPHLISKLTEI